MVEFDNHYNSVIIIYMSKTIIQVPIEKSLRDQALHASSEMGFSSLQESIRLFLSQLAKRKVDILIYSRKIQIHSGFRCLKMISIHFLKISETLKKKGKIKRSDYE